MKIIKRNPLTHTILTDIGLEVTVPNILSKDNEEGIDIRTMLEAWNQLISDNRVDRKETKDE